MIAKVVCEMVETTLRSIDLFDALHPFNQPQVCHSSNKSF